MTGVACFLFAMVCFVCCACLWLVVVCWCLLLFRVVDCCGFRRCLLIDVYCSFLFKALLWYVVLFHVMVVVSLCAVCCVLLFVSCVLVVVLCCCVVCGCVSSLRVFVCCALSFLFLNSFFCR